MEKKLKNFILIISTLVPILSISQTTTFDYVNTNLGANCNVFNPSVNVSNVSHSSWAGGVLWSSSSGLLLNTYPGAQGSVGGTAFVINYTFSPGYSYTISVTALGDAALFLNTSVVPNLNQFNSQGSSLCKPDSYVTGYSTAGTGIISTAVTNSSANYTTSSFRLLLLIHT